MSQKLPDALVKKLTAVVQRHCPQATLKVTPDQFQASYKTMVFTLHGHQMTGEFMPKTYQEEGPNFRGFVLSITIEPGRYDCQAVVPQELMGPYYPTFLDCPLTDSGNSHFHILFSYGHRLDPALKKALQDALPSSRGA